MSSIVTVEDISLDFITAEMEINVDAHPLKLSLDASPVLPDSVETVDFAPLFLITDEDGETITDEDEDPLYMDVDYMGRAEVLTCKKADTLVLAREM